MKCPHCKKEIPDQAQFCGFCGEKISKKKHRRFPIRFFVVLVIIGILAAGIAFVFLCKGKNSGKSELITVNTTGMSEQEYIQVAEPVIASLVTDENSAIAAAGDFGETAGFDNALKELTVKSKNELDSITYYRLQETYKGIPVYGCTIVLAADENGSVQRIHANVVDIPEALRTDLDMSEADAKESIQKYLEDKGKFEMELSDFESKTPVIYAFSETPVFAYQMEAVIDQELYEVVIDADSKEVLLCTTKNYTEMATARGKDKDDNFVSFTANQLAEDSWILEDTERNMRVYDAAKQSEILPKQVFLVDAKGNTYEQNGDTWTGNDGKTVTVQANPEPEMQNQLHILDANGTVIDDKGYYTLDLYGKKSRLELIRENTDFFSNGKAVTLFLNAGTTYDFFEQKFHRTGFNSKNGSMSLVFNSIEGTCSRDISKDKLLGLLIFNKNANLSYEDIAHEYTHSVERTESAMLYEGESGAIMEAYSDLFGELVEDYADGKMDGSCDWEHHAGKEFGYDQSRNLENPKESGNPSHVGEETRKGIEYLVVEKNEVHHCSTIVSHAGYLMTVNGEKSKGLSTKELAQLWYHTMLTLPSNCSFSVLRSNMEATAEAIGLSERKKLRISQAFEEVGIESYDFGDSTTGAEQKETYEPKWVVKPAIEADDIYYIQNLNLDKSWNEQNMQLMGNYAVIEKDGSLGLIDMDGKLKGQMDYGAIHSFGYDEKVLLDRIEPVYTEKYKTDWSLFMLEGDTISPIDGLGGGDFTYAYYAEKEEIKVFDEMAAIYHEYLLTVELEGYEKLEQNLTVEKDMDAGALKLESIKVNTVFFDHQYRDDKETAVITGLDKDGNAVWSITTGEYPVTQLEGVQEIGIRGNRYYYVEDTEIIVLNLADGTECWRNSDFSGGSISFDFGPDDTLYICGAFSPDFFAVDRNGNTLKKIVTFNEKFYWPYKVEYQENQVAVSMDGGPNGDDANVVFYVNLRDYSYEYSYMEDGLSEEQIASIRGQLGVPSDSEITCEQSEKYYWDAGERWLIYVSFVKDGKTVASADVDAETGEFIRNILNYSN